MFWQKQLEANWWLVLLLLMPPSPTGLSTNLVNQSATIYTIKEKKVVMWLVFLGNSLYKEKKWKIRISLSFLFSINVKIHL